MSRTTTHIAAAVLALVLTTISFQQTITVPLATATTMALPALA